MSKEERQGENLFFLNQRIQDRETQRRKLFLENVADLKKIFDEELFKLEYENWAGFLGQLGVYYSRNEVDTWRKVYEFFIDKHNFDPDIFIGVPVSRLDDIRRLETINKVQISELIDKAKELPSRDWKDEIAEFLGKPTTSDCKHDYTTYDICNTCGEKHRKQ